MEGYSLEHPKNALDVCIDEWEQAIHLWESKALEAAELDGMFKAFEAASKKAICD